MARVGLLLIATGKYDQFVGPLLASAEKYFFRGEEVDIYLFSDKPYTKPVEQTRFNLQVMEIKHYPFPLATLYRYKHFDAYRNVIKSEYVFYLDVDMEFVSEVGPEILGEIVCVEHPGFYRGGWGSENCSPDSLAYLPKEARKGYKAGGFQGGAREKYLEACNILHARIMDDESRGIMAEWHDETHWNWYLKTLAPKAKVLSPSYCFPEANWAKNMPFPKKIMALEKNHAEIRK